MHPTRHALRTAFPHTLPVLTGYLFLGIAFGILLQSSGYGAAWALLMSLTIYAGSMQFVAVGILAGGFSPLYALLLTLMVNARHIFYGIAMLEPFKRFRRAKSYMIFALTDETFSLLCAVKPPEGVDVPRFYLCVALLDQLYWITGSVLGALAGAALSFNAAGIEFVMPALFVVIFLEQWQSREGRGPAMLGIGVAFVCLLLFGSEWFILPTMALLTALLLAVKPSAKGGIAP
ncbi:branched-chain amino acid transporter AzlC [Clostridia bacterium]|nr:branched-chain amino acid transporter AzlC [Clostridia bacterium]